MLKIECAHHYASVLCTFFLEGCFVAVVCMQVAEHYNKSPFHLCLCLSLSLSLSLSFSLSLPPSLSPSLSLSLSLSSLSLSLSLSLSRLSPSLLLTHSEALSLPLIHSCTFFSGIRSFRDCVMSGWKGISDRFAFFLSSLSYMSFFSRIGKIKACLSAPSSSKTGFLRSKFALHGLTWSVGWLHDQRSIMLKLALESATKF